MKVEEFASLLFEVEVNAHIMHLQTGSYSAHIALNSLYTDIVDLRDRYLECHQAEFGIVKGYKNINVYEGKNPVKYLEEVCAKVHEYHATIGQPYLQAIIEDIQELLYSTKYKLVNLR